MVHPKLLAAALAATLTGLFGSAAAPGQPLATPKPLFPVTIEASNGRVTIPRRPTRIVSLSPTLTENLFAVGAGKQVVAVDERSNYPKSAPRTKLSGFQPNAEAIAGYRPDLVFLHPGGGEIVAQLNSLGIRVLQLPAAVNLSQAYREILQVGRATGHPRAAQGVVRSIKSRLNAAVTPVKRSGSARLAVYTSSPPTTTRPPPGRSSVRSTSCSDSGTSRTAPRVPGRATRSSRESTSSRPTPT